MEDVQGALLTDLYEVTMIDAYRRAGMAERPATFSLFVRNLPADRGYLVAAGLDDVLGWLESLAFGEEELTALERVGVVDPELIAFLSELRFTGRVRAVPEGTIVFANEPILEVDAPMAQAQLAETFLLNQITLQTTLATKAARHRQAAGDKTLLDFGARRSQGIDAAMKLSRCCRIVGFDGTSNIAGADRYGLAASGTMAHSFVLASADEADAFRSIAKVSGAATVLLVDTYDTRRGVQSAIEVATELRAQGVEIGGLRLDSGDLAALARATRRELDAAGFPEVRIIASGGLDEHQIEQLVNEGAPIDGFGAGTALAVSNDAPTLDTVYKLVAFDGRPVRKTSPAKETWPGAKQVWRDSQGSGDVLALAHESAPGPSFEPLLTEVMVDGVRTAAGSLDLSSIRANFERSWAALPGPVRLLDAPQEHPVEVSGALRSLADSLDRPA